MAANNITGLTTANTFQHWLNSTNALISTANLLTDGNGQTLYANTKIEIGGINTCLNVRSYIEFVDGTRQNTAFNSAKANSSFDQANAAFIKANTANVYAYSAFDKANSAYTVALASAGAVTSITGSSPISTSGTTSVSISHNNSGVVPGSYGTSVLIPSFTVDAKGHITYASSAIVRPGTTTQSGIVQLTDATNSTSTTTAATANAVKAAYDLANTANSRPAGSITINNGTGITGGGTGLSFTLGIDPNAVIRVAGLGVNRNPSGAGALDITGTLSCSGAVSTGAITSTGDITAFYSDERLKENIINIENALDKVYMLRGVYYNANDIAVSYGYKKEKKVGVIAQDVEKVLPEIVVPAPFDIDDEGNSKSGEHYKTVQYDKLVPLLIESIKELKREIDYLKSRINEE